MKQKTLFTFPKRSKKEATKSLHEFSLSRRNTQEKLEVYAKYLKVYLNVLFFKHARNKIPKLSVFINICDMFAGRGDYDGKQGSAVLALEIIKEFQEKIKDKDINISLYLNDKDEKCFQSLGEVIRSAEAEGWAHCSHMDANDAIKKRMAEFLDKERNFGGEAKFYNLFYLDPFGYSELEKSSIGTIVGDDKSHNECILFVPVTRIAQFIKRGESNLKQMPSIRKFCEEYSINFQEAEGLEGFGKIIKKALADAYYPSYVGSVRLQAKGANYYALYFIGSHIYGLDRFMEVVKSVKSSNEPIRQRSPLGMFDFLWEHDLSESEIMSYLSEPRTNCELYEHLLRGGWEPTLMNKLLGIMKEQGKISVQPLKKGLRKGSLYLRHKSPKVCLQAKTNDQQGNLL